MNRYLVLIGLLGVFTACFSRQPASPPPVQAEPAAVPEQKTAGGQNRNLQRSIEADGFSSKGTIQAVTEVPVYSRISEQIVSFDIELGQRVRKGEVVVRLSQDVLKDKIARGKAELENAEYHYQAILMGQGYKRGQMDDAPEELREADEHPYANLYVYAGADPGRLFGVLKTGAFTDDGDKEDPDRFFWMDKASSKLTPAKLVFSPEYKGEDLTEDVLSTFGAPNLYYSVSNKQFYNSFHDRGFNVIIEEVGPTAVSYEWNGVEFVRSKDYKVPCIYNYGFANFMLGDDVPWTVPGFTTSTYAVQEGDASFTLVKSGAEEPALVFHASGDDKVFEIEVCSGPYCNPYGVYPGMKVSEFMELVAKINSRYDEPTYVSFNDENADFVDIYAGFDEDFVYRVPKSQYMGDERFAPDAVIARVVVINAVG